MSHVSSFERSLPLPDPDEPTSDSLCVPVSKTSKTSSSKLHIHCGTQQHVAVAFAVANADPQELPRVGQNMAHEGEMGTNWWQRSQTERQVSEKVHLN